MKIFISHASANKDYGNALVELLRGVGLSDNDIIFTSNVGYGIPIAKNIFKWLKSQITEKPFVIYLLSKEYYASIACLNEMGAAWIVENEHAVIFAPNFDINSKEFQNGALDPREIGFHFNDEERLLSFIQHLRTSFNVTSNSVVINQQLKSYLFKVNSLNSSKPINLISEENKVEKIQLPESKPTIESSKEGINAAVPVKEEIFAKFIIDIKSNKLKDEDILLLHYMIDRSKSKLMTGWQEASEISTIKDWEEVHELNTLLSVNYSAVIRRFDLRGYTQVSGVTASGNAKEVTLKPEIASILTDVPQELSIVVSEVLSKNSSIRKTEDDSLPF